MPEMIDDNEIDTLSFSTEEKEAPKQPRHYIDDNHLTKILSIWKKEFDANKAAGIERPRLPEAVGEAFFDMSEAMGKRFNFRDYSYLDEMKADAILHCVKYIHNFNPDKISEKKGKVSAFGYINKIIWHSFTHRIESEKREQYLKYKSLELMGGAEAFQDEDMADLTGEDGSEMNISVLAQDFRNKVAEYENKYGLDKPKKEKKIVLDDFMFNLCPAVEESDDMELEMVFE